MKKIPNLPIGWKSARLGEISTLVGGGTPSRKNPEYFTGDIVWLTPTQIPKNKVTVVRDSEERITSDGLKNSSAKILPKDTVLMTSRASIGYIAIAGTEVTTNQGFASFICNREIYNWYLAYWLMSQIPQIEHQATGTTFKEISKSKLRNFVICFPEMEGQKLIVAKIEELFSQLDAGVAGFRRAKSKLERYRASVLKAAFEGRLVPQDANDEPAGILLQRIGKERLDNNKHLPKGWVWSNLGDLSEYIQYGYTQSADEKEIGPKFLRITDIQNGKVNWKKVPYCEIDYEDISKYQLNSGDIVFARTGATTGKSYLINKCPKSVFASYLIRIRLVNIVIPEYCYLYFQSPMYWSQIMVTRKGSAQPGVNASILSKMKIPLAPLPEQRRIINIVKQKLSIVEEIESEIERSQLLSNHLRQTILNKAFLGELVIEEMDNN